MRIVRLVVALALAAGVLTLSDATPSSADIGPRVAGGDRYATAAAVSKSAFAAGVPVAFVVTGGAFPDALAAGPSAAHLKGPVLLVARDSVPQSTGDELTRLNPGRIVVVGGPGAVSDAVVAQMDMYTTGTVTRVQGDDRYGTAAAVSKHAFTSATTVYVTGGVGFADALAGAPAAYKDGAPLLLVQTSAVPTSTADEIKRLGAKSAVILGGSASVDGNAESQLRALVATVTRVAGSDRYGTSVAASQRAFPTKSTTAYLASGAGYADALAGGPAAALTPAPILLSRANCVPKPVSDELFRLGATKIVLLGGTGALMTGVERVTVCPYAGVQSRTPAPESGHGNVWSQSAPDPDLVRIGGNWYLYATGSAWGNNIGVLVSTSPNSGWRTTTGQNYGSTALPNPPSWQTVNTQWAPGVLPWRGRYVMFYAARMNSTGHWCITVSTSSSPTGPFVDTSSGPMVCQLDIGGSIDPQPWVDEDGRPWLLWKNNDGSTADVSRVWSAPLSADGTAIAGPVREVMAKNTQLYTWQTTLDNPQMVLAGGVHYLFYTSGNWEDDTYRVGYAVCAGPVGPCTSGANPILQSYDTVAGPGGGTVEQAADGGWWMAFHAWDSSCTNDRCGGTRRLYVTPLAFT